jgi:hypothetical protein
MPESLVQDFIAPRDETVSPGTIQSHGPKGRFRLRCGVDVNAMALCGRNAGRNSE